MGIYQTATIAKMIDVHPNTIRLYEDINFISKPMRKTNGYRVFTDLHYQQLQIVRNALEIPVIQNGIRKLAIQIIKETAKQNYKIAYTLTKQYIDRVNAETIKAEEAIYIVEHILETTNSINSLVLTRKQTAKFLNITVDTLRNWELNGLLTVKRMQNGYRVYMDKDIQRLKIISTLRCANYSLAAILNLLNTLDTNDQKDIKTIIDTPFEKEMVSICDTLLTSLTKAKHNAIKIKRILESLMQEDYSMKE